MGVFLRVLCRTQRLFGATSMQVPRVKSAGDWLLIAVNAAWQAAREGSPTIDVVASPP
jgi:hypothetical protein